MGSYPLQVVVGCSRHRIDTAYFEINTPMERMTYQRPIRRVRHGRQPPVGFSRDEELSMDRLVNGWG